MTVPSSLPSGSQDTSTVSLGSPSGGQPPLVDKNTLSKYKHFYSLTPVCRIHVYKKNEGKPYGVAGPLPSHWCINDPKDTSNNSKAPELILGKDGIYLDDKRPMDWQVLSARVNSTRQWQCSSATFQIAHPLDASTPASACPIAPNDIIVMEMGYCNGIDSNVSTTSGRTNYDAFVGDVVFYGIIDSIKERGGSGDKDGIVFSVFARDPMSILTDNKMRGHYNPKNLQGYNRAFIVRDLLWRGAAIDYVKWTLDTSQRDGYARDKAGFRIPLPAQTGQNEVQPESFGSNNCYLNIGTLEQSQRAEIKIPDEGAQTGIILTDKFPLDVIRHFSLVETAPRELWADRRTGQVHWQFRRTDMRRLLHDSASRQYFYRFPANRANIMSYTMEWSTAGTITHFTITNPTASAQNTGQTSEMYAESPTSLLLNPHVSSDGGKNQLRPLTRNRFIYDDTLLSEEDSPVVASSLFNIWGRCIQTGMVMVPGDPSLEIGEALQIFNTGLFGKRWHEDTQATNAQPSNGSNSDLTTDAKVQAAKGFPEGVFRIEAITHLFAVGGAQMGYRSVFILGPIDDDTGSADHPRLIKEDSDASKVLRINITDQPDNGNEAVPGTPG